MTGISAVIDFYQQDKLSGRNLMQAHSKKSTNLDESLVILNR